MGSVAKNATKFRNAESKSIGFKNITFWSVFSLLLPPLISFELKSSVQKRGDNGKKR